MNTSELQHLSGINFTGKPASNLSEEARHFTRLQQELVKQFDSAFPDKMAPKTVIIIPSLTLDQEILEKITGVIHYEERLLCLLMLLRMPKTHVVYVTSMPIDEVIIDYYLHLLPGITGYHARQRLTLLSCFDGSSKSLTHKILERPRLIERIRKSIPEKHMAHLACFNVTGAERRLAVKLKYPIYGCDPDLECLGTKSNSRKIFKACGLKVPDGYEDLKTEHDIVDALVKLKISNPFIAKAVVKVNEGFSGEGNAVFSYAGAPATYELATWIAKSLPLTLKMVAADLSYEAFVGKVNDLGGIAEVFLEGAIKRSPSVQCRINPVGVIDVVSTHDQLFSEKNEQIFIGAEFPASNEYAREIGKMGRCVSETLKKEGVMGRFAIDFISVKEGDEWVHYAIEINLRKGGTTHPFLMLQFLTDGEYDAAQGIYFAANNQPKYYISSDNLQSENYKGLTPHDLIDIAMCNDLLYDGASQQGVMFHLISALSEFGKLGIVCIGSSAEEARRLYYKTIEVLDKEKNTQGGSNGKYDPE